MKSLLVIQKKGKHIYFQLHEQLQRYLPTTEIKGKNNVLVELQVLHKNAYSILKWKWALVFKNVEQLNNFLKEVKDSKEKQYKLGIENYSVFDNVFFAFLRRQYHFQQFSTIILEIINHIPMAILLFDLTYKQLIKYVENDANFYYNIAYNYNPKKRQLNKSLDEDEYSSEEECKQMKKVKQQEDSEYKPICNQDNIKQAKKVTNELVYQFKDINANLTKLAEILDQID